MCNTCGCNITPGNAHLAQRTNAQGDSAVEVLQGLLSENDRIAAHNRAHFEQHGVLAVNLMSSPGAGKTALLEASIDALKSASHLRDVNITMMLGNLNAAVKNYPVALQYYQKAESIKQGYVPAIFQQAAVLHTMGKKKEAIAGYQRVVTLSENYVPALNNLAYLYAEDRSALATALQYAVRAYVLAPKEGSVQDTLGFVLLKNGKPEEGLKALKLAEAALPNNPAVHYHLALAYKELNQSSAAAEHLQKAISLGDFPEQREARAMLAQLKNTEERAGR